MTQPSEGQKRQDMLFLLEEFKKSIWKRQIPHCEVEKAFDDLVTILTKGL